MYEILIRPKKLIILTFNPTALKIFIAFPVFVLYIDRCQFSLVPFAIIPSLVGLLISGALLSL